MACNKNKKLRFLPTDKKATWIRSIKEFVRETVVSNLDLSFRKIEISEAISIFKFLVYSQITEVDLQHNDLRDGMQYLCDLLVRTKVKKLNISGCELTNNDLVHLINILKYSEITDLDFSHNNIQFDKNLACDFTSHLLQSHITHLNIGMNCFTSEAGAALTQWLPKSSITCLNLRGIVKENDSLSHIITPLSLNLEHTVITDLNLSDNNLSSEELEQLSRSLRFSKVEKLNLSHSCINDTKMNVLCRGLVHSKIIALNVSSNWFSGNNNLGQYLKYTPIQTLDLSENSIQHDEMFHFPDFLKGSSVRVLKLHRCSLGNKIGQELMKSLKFTDVIELDVSGNDLKFSSYSELLKSVKFTHLTDIDLSGNNLSGEVFSILGNCLKNRKLNRISVGHHLRFCDCKFLFGFLERSKQSTVTSLSLTRIDFSSNGNFLSLGNTSFTHLDFNHCKFSRRSVFSLGAALKFSSVTHLVLKGNADYWCLEDEGIEALAKYLKETQIVKLDISNNAISNDGAKALASSLKNTNILYLILKGNEIKSDGLYYLAEQISSTFITVLDVDSNEGAREGEALIVIDRTLWENRKIVHQLINTFKRIAPKINDINFQFCRNSNNSNLNALLEDCLFLYQTFLERPSLASVLAQDDSFSLSRSQITTLMSKDFPRQFAMFIGGNVEADVAQYIYFLRRTEDLGLNDITELLLLNRPAYLIDENQNKLHPYVYTLMHKYKQPIINSMVEPYHKEKIIEYFIEA